MGQQHQPGFLGQPGDGLLGLGFLLRRHRRKLGITGIEQLLRLRQRRFGSGKGKVLPGKRFQLLIFLHQRPVASQVGGSIGLGKLGGKFIVAAVRRQKSFEHGKNSLCEFSGIRHRY